MGQRRITHTYSYSELNEDENTNTEVGEIYPNQCLDIYLQLQIVLQKKKDLEQKFKFPS